MKTEVILVRHAEAYGNIKRYFQGWSDGKLSEKGHRQGQLVGERLKEKKIDVIYSSPLSRTRDTANYIAQHHKLELKLRDDLKEIHGGDWENHAFAELPVHWPDEYYTWNYEPHKHVMPNGESMEDLYERIKACILDIIDKHKGKNICIVSHGTAIRAFMTYALNIPFEKINEIPWYENTSVSVFSVENDEIKVLLEGDIAHLEKEMRTLGNQEWFEEYTNYIKEQRR